MDKKTRKTSKFAAFAEEFLSNFKYTVVVLAFLFCLQIVYAIEPWPYGQRNWTTVLACVNALILLFGWYNSNKYMKIYRRAFNQTLSILTDMIQKDAVHGPKIQVVQQKFDDADLKIAGCGGERRGDPTKN